MNEITFFGEYSFEKSPMVVMRGLEVCDMPRKQLEILALLLEAGGEVVSREEILDSVWRDAIVEEHNLTQTVFLLRRALGRMPDGQEYIETVPKRGYRLSPSALIHDPQPMLEPQSPADVKATYSFRSRRAPEPTWTYRLRSLLTYAPLLPVVVLTILLAWALGTGRLQLRHADLISSRQITRNGQHKESTSPLLLRNQTLYFSGHLAGQDLIARVETSGGEVLTRPSPAGAGWLSSLHPTKDELLFSDSRADGTIITSDLSGEASQPLGFLHGHAAVWSPDGRQIAYARDHQLRAADPSGQSRVIADHLPGVAFWLSWSPDGQRLRFSLQEIGDRQSLQEVDLQTGRVTPLLPGSVNEHHVCCGSWSRDGRYFVYLAVNTSDSSIWVRREGWAGDSFGRRNWRIASGPVDFWRSPVISSDRSHIYAIGEQMRNHLVSLTGGFASVLDPLSIGSLSFSHDGQWVAYTTYPEGSLWKSRPDGSERTQIGDPRLHFRSPQWAADDSALFYLRAHDGEAWTIARLDLAQAGQERLIDRGAEIASYAYTPIGDKVAYNTMSDPQAGTSNISVLSLGSRTVEPIPQSSELSDLRWSPDGRYLAAITTNHHALRLFAASTKDWITVTTADEVRSIAWDRERSNLYFTAGNGSRRVIRKYVVSNRAISDVVEVPDRYQHGHASRVLEVGPRGDLLYGYSDGGAEIYDLTVELP